MNRFNPNRPYVWELKVTEDEFLSLENNLRSYTPDASKKDDALKILVYLAEWYKRRYTNRAKKEYQKTFGGKKPNVEIVWKTLAIDEKYLYRGENEQKLYLYSTFIFSGLAVKFERQKNEKPFLRALCRVYNKEDESFDRVVDNNHSIAFKESIAQGHSLRDFLEAIITSQDNINALPFSNEDYDNPDTEVALLIELIREINNEVNKSKFRFEWIVTSIPGDNLIARRLHLWLNPEGKGKLHQLLSIDRLKKWGFAEPENMCYVRLGVRYLKGNKVVKEPDFHRPDLYYRNTGDSSIGFICENVDYVKCNNVPVSSFDKVQLITWNEDGTELPIPIQEETVDFDTLQLYRMEAGEDEWTTRVSNQKETALLFSDMWIIAETSADHLFERKTFYNKKVGEGDSVSWCYIHASVTIENEDESLTFYNRQGYDHIIARLYNEAIDYTADGKVMLHYAEDEDSQEKNIPISLIFGKEDIVVYHTETKDGEDCTCEETDVQLYEFKKKGNYTSWTETDSPEYGYVELRLTIKGKPQLFKAFYLPKPIERNLETNTIHYNNVKEEQVYNDKDFIENAINRRQVLEPTVRLNVGTKACYVIIPVFRPIKLKEIIYDGKIMDYIKEGAYELPYILHKHITLHSYSESGYKEYKCSYLTGVHSLIKQKRPNNPNAAWASSAAWEKGDIYIASDIDTNAPDYLLVKMGEKLQKELNKEEFYFWDYDQNHPLVKMPRKGVTTPKDWGVVFQSNKKNRTGKNFYPLYNEEDDDIFDDDSDDHFANVSIIRCFNIAIEHELYFFTLTPLKNLSEEDFNKQLLLPILKHFEGTPPPEICLGLRRFVEEFDYQDKDKYFNIINSNI
ncbi:MAG: hypothetical protein SO440_13335 [Prevotella sp.]|nr:hypothetical protein [Prevotella sp.]